RPTRPPAPAAGTKVSRRPPDRSAALAGRIHRPTTQRAALGIERDQPATARTRPPVHHRIHVGERLAATLERHAEVREQIALGRRRLCSNTHVSTVAPREGLVGLEPTTYGLKIRRSPA